MRLKFFFILTMLFVCSCEHSSTDTVKAWTTRDGVVPDATTAIAVAITIGERIYGKETIENEKPFKASLVNGKIWVIEGTHVEALGGVLHLEMQKSDGKILYVMHGK